MSRARFFWNPRKTKERTHAGKVDIENEKGTQQGNPDRETKQVSNQKGSQRKQDVGPSEKQIFFSAFFILAAMGTLFCGV